MTVRPLLCILASAAAALSFAAAASAAFPGPNGRIAFTSNRGRSGAVATPDLYTMNADGTGVTRLTRGGDDEQGPSWTQ